MFDYFRQSQIVGNSKREHNRIHAVPLSPHLSKRDPSVLSKLIVEELMDRLADSQQQALRLVYFDRCSPRQAASELGMKSQAFRSRTARAMKRLREEAGIIQKRALL